MVQRDKWKQIAKDLAISSGIVCPAQAHAWSQYNIYRNKINNRMKIEENVYKSNKMAEVSDNPELVWKSAKSFIIIYFPREGAGEGGVCPPWKIP